MKTLEGTDMTTIRSILLGWGLLLLSAMGVQAQQAGLRASVFSTGAGASDGGGVRVQSTLGQAVVESSRGNAYQVNVGFWFQARPPAVVAVNQPPSAPQITEPADGTEVVVGGSPGHPPLDPETPFRVAWTEAADADGDPVTYTWQLATGDDFSTLLWSVDAGATSRVETTLGALAAVLDAAGVALGESTALWHRTVATDGRYATPGTPMQVTFTRGTLVSREGEPRDVPVQYRLFQNYPNPFNPATAITYELPTASPVRLVVYDLFGREVATLVDATQAAGRYEVAFDGARLASGLYVYRIEAGAFRQMRRMMLVK